MQFQKVTLAGVGLLGGSLGLALKQRGLAAKIDGLVRRTASIAECASLGVVDHATRDAHRAAEGADLVVLCTPISHMREVLEKMAPSLKPGVVVTDVGSVKGSVVADLEPMVAAAGGHFVGSHPMAGAERFGPSASRPDLFVDAVCVVTPTPRTSSIALRRVEDLWKGVGGRLLRLRPEEHDDLVSRSSHLPHVVAAELANYVLSPIHPKEQRLLCATGFRDTTRVASSHPGMWHDIVMANRENLLRVLGVFIEDLEEFRHALESGDSQSVMEFFEQARTRRDAWTAEKISPSSEYPPPPPTPSMPLPEMLEIQPLAEPATASVVVPGSKSITNRALILAALAEKPVTLHGALWSEDTEVMVRALEQLGFGVQVTPDPLEAGNRSIRVQGGSGRIPRAGTPAQPLGLHVQNAGTAARFLAAFVCLGQGSYRIDGIPRMRERPQAALFAALRQLGYAVESPNDRLPAVIHGSGPRRAACRISVDESSQFASALLLASRAGHWHVEIAGDDHEEAPYVTMTSRLMEEFPFAGGSFQVEPDASGGSYLHAAAILQQLRWPNGPRIEVANAPATPWQVDARFPTFWPLPQTISRRTDLADSIMTAVILAPFASHPVRFTDLGRLRVQECERVVALRQELTKCGARVEESGDTLCVYPGTLHGAEIETYNDHRMAMCFATLGLHVPGIKIKNPSCVRKTFPTFFNKLASPPPAGLGARLFHPGTGLTLIPAECVAD